MNTDHLRAAKRAMLGALMLLFLGACSGNSGGEGQDTLPSGPTVQQVLDAPREYIDRPVILRGRVREVLGLRAFLLEEGASQEQSGGNANGAGNGSPGEGLLVVRAESPLAVRALVDVPEVRVFAGDTLSVAGPLVLFNLNRFEEALGVDLNDVVLRRYEGEPVLIALVVDRVEQEDQGQSGNGG